MTLVLFRRIFLWMAEKSQPSAQTFPVTAQKQDHQQGAGLVPGESAEAAGCPGSRSRQEGRRAAGIRGCRKAPGGSRAAEAGGRGAGKETKERGAGPCPPGKAACHRAGRAGRAGPSGAGAPGPGGRGGAPAPGGGPAGYRRDRHVPGRDHPVYHGTAWAQAAQTGGGRAGPRVP